MTSCRHHVVSANGDPCPYCKPGIRPRVTRETQLVIEQLEGMVQSSKLFLGESSHLQKVLRAAIRRLLELEVQRATIH